MRSTISTFSLCKKKLGLNRDESRSAVEKLNHGQGVHPLSRMTQLDVFFLRVDIDKFLLNLWVFFSLKCI